MRSIGTQTGTATCENAYTVFACLVCSVVLGILTGGVARGHARSLPKWTAWLMACCGAQGLPFTVFQPLYIYGPHTSKDCEQWFMERVLRGRPVPIPAPGIQLTTLTHVADVASMLAKAGPLAAVGLVQISACRSEGAFQILWAKTWCKGPALAGAFTGTG